jgi:hypothetical protein
MSASNPISWDDRISADSDTVDRFLADGMTAQTPSDADFQNAIEWLALYGAESHEDAQPFANVIAYLMARLDERARRTAINTAKREYAAAHGIPVSQVRIAR